MGEGDKGLNLMSLDMLKWHLSSHVRAIFGSYAQLQISSGHSVDMQCDHAQQGQDLLSWYAALYIHLGMLISLGKSQKCSWTKSLDQ